MNQNLLHQLFRGLLVLFILSVIVFVFYYVTPLIFPFLIGWIIAYMLNPLVNLLQKKAKLPRWLSVTLTLTVVIGLTTVGLIIVFTNIIVEISNLSKTVQQSIDMWKNQLNTFLQSPYMQSLLKSANTFYNENPNFQGTINSNLELTGKNLANASSEIITAILNDMIRFISSIPNIATVMVIGILSAFFISKDWFRWKSRISSLFSEKTQSTGRVIWHDLQKALFGYVRTQLILISITAVIITVGLILLRVPYAIAMGLLTGIVDLLPYIGTGALMIPWIIITFIQGNIYFGIGLSIIYGVVLITRQMVEPKVLASSVGLEPLPILIAMFVGLKLFGVKGLIIGPVSFVIIASFYRANVFTDIRQYILYGKVR